MTFQKHKFPLLINIFWDNESEEMHTVAKYLYQYFSGNIEKPLDRYLNIPVHRYANIPNIETLGLGEAVYSANIFLVDYHMNINTGWKTFSNRLTSNLLSKKDSMHRIFPIIFQEKTIAFNPRIQAYNLSKSGDRQSRLLLIYLTHNLCRQLYGKGQALEKEPAITESPVTLFLSHAKKDGKEIAESLQRHINELPGLRSFFDPRDISGGVEFEVALENSIKESILVVLHTDEYSTREWCRREVLLAKKHKRPVIVINRYHIGELRSFPYIGNVPHVRYPTDEEEELKGMDCIVLESIREVLRVKHHELRVDLLSRFSNKKVNVILSYPPELVSLLELKGKEEQVVLYPDPPLGKEELNILEDFYPNMEFTTPTLLPLISENGKDVIVLNLKVAISLSETDKSDIAEIMNQDLANLIVEMTRYLLVSGVQLIYSGRIDYGAKNNYANLLIDLVKTYRSFYQNTDQEIINAIDNYSFYPLHDLLSTEERSELESLVNFIPVPPPIGLNATPAKAKEIVAFDSIPKKYVWAKSLTEMRKMMMDSANALIVLGGKSIGFKGKMPGVLEETIIALKLNRPVYLIGSYGGVAGTIIEALQGARPEKLKIFYFESHYPEYTHFLKEFNTNEWTESKEQVDFLEIVNYLNSVGKDIDFGLNNGLSVEENQQLFITRNEVEIINLILKGLKTLI